jgi:hypothetical protein
MLLVVEWRLLVDALQREKGLSQFDGIDAIFISSTLELGFYAS